MKLCQNPNSWFTYAIVIFLLALVSLLLWDSLTSKKEVPMEMNRDFIVFECKTAYITVDTKGSFVIRAEELKEEK